MPRSNRNDESVLNEWRFAVLRIETGWKYALSKKIAFVISETADDFPPKTPAMHSGPFSSQIMTSSDESVR